MYMQYSTFVRDVLVCVNEKLIIKRKCAMKLKGIMPIHLTFTNMQIINRQYAVFCVNDSKTNTVMLMVIVIIIIQKLHYNQIMNA